MYLQALPRNLENREAEGTGLPGACFGGEENVSAAENERDGLGLNVGWQRPSHVVDCLADLREHAELLKRCHGREVVTYDEMEKFYSSATANLLKLLVSSLKLCMPCPCGLFTFQTGSEGVQAARLS